MRFELENAWGEIHLIGIGAVRFRPDLLAKGTDCVLMAGLAGGLDPSLQVGNMVVDEQSDGDIPPIGSLRPRRGGIHTADRLIATVADKSELFKQTGALAVEMENAIVREAAAKAQIPFIGLRIISDTAQQALDPAIMGFINEIGRVRIGRLAAGLARRPGLIGPLRQLGIHASLACDQLAGTVRQWIDASQ
jgi:adenosylhomocysteine nucleosidase